MQPAKVSKKKNSPLRSRPDAKIEVDRSREKAEALEVVGRHKNEGQKDHKGAR